MRYKKLFLSLSTASLLVTSALSFASETDRFEISKQTDLILSCGELSQEATSMRDTIFTTQERKNQSKMRKHGVTAAGAVGSFVVGTVTGGLGLAAAGFLLEQNFEDDNEKADDLQDNAAQRRTLMMGIYNAKGCYGPLEHAMQNPEKQDILDNLAKLEPAAGQAYHTELRKRYND